MRSVIINYQYLLLYCFLNSFIVYNPALHKTLDELSFLLSARRPSTYVRPRSKLPREDIFRVQLCVA